VCVRVCVCVCVCLWILKGVCLAVVGLIGASWRLGLGSKTSPRIIVWTQWADHGHY
jgi:hypothetical protein